MPKKTCCDRLRKKLDYVYQVWLHPESWIRWSTQWVDPWAKSSTVISFCAWEGLNSTGCMAFYLYMMNVVKIGKSVYDKDWIFLYTFLTYRIIYACCGLRAAFLRKMRATWIFLGMLAVNAAIVAGATAPLFHYSCKQAADLDVSMPWDDARATRSDPRLTTWKEYFSLTDAGIHFETVSGRLPNCTDASSTGEEPANEFTAGSERLHLAFRRLADATADVAEGASLHSPVQARTPEATKKLLGDRLRECLVDRLCGLVELQVRHSPARGHLQRVCSYPTDLTPTLRQSMECTDESSKLRQCNGRSWGVSVFFYKNVVNAMQRTLALQQIEEEHEKLCQVIRMFLLCMLWFLNVANAFMFVVVWKFVTNRCGDHFVVETQFEVEFSDDEDDDYSDDDRFEVGFSDDFRDDGTSSRRSSRRTSRTSMRRGKDRLSTATWETDATREALSPRQGGRRRPRRKKSRSGSHSQGLCPMSEPVKGSTTPVTIEMAAMKVQKQDSSRKLVLTDEQRIQEDSFGDPRSIVKEDNTGWPTNWGFGR